MRRTNEAAVILGLGILLFAPRASLGQAPERTPVVTTPRFAFYSDFDTNLNDALIAAGIARKGGKPELFHAEAEVSCFGKLPQSARAAWGGAVDYYAEIISPAEWNNRQQYLLRVQLAGFDEELKDAGARQFVEIARSFRAAATPAYKACRWTAQDEKNRRWIEELKPRLAADEQRVALRLEQLYRKQWNGLPIHVDVVETVSWSGANSIFPDSAGGHLLISNSYQGPAALELVFHEASHGLMGRGDPLRQALETGANAVSFRLPGDLWHVVLFYTTGEAVRRVLDDGGKSGYTPLVYGIFDRGTWASYRRALESTWRPYIDGERALSEAAADLIEGLRRPGEPQPDDRQPITEVGLLAPIMQGLQETGIDGDRPLDHSLLAVIPPTSISRRVTYPMATTTSQPPVLELRVALTTESFDRLVAFYRQGLGLEPSQTWPEEQGRALVLDLGRATLEVFDEKQANTVDQLEVGRRVSGRIRFALQVPDLDIAAVRLQQHGGTLVHGPVLTPWGDRTVRFQDPDGMQVTLYQTPYGS